MFNFASVSSPVQRKCAFASVALLVGIALLPTPILARGGLQRPQPWSGERIEQLPAEVRSRVTAVCAHPTAQSNFVSTFSNPERILLRYERLHCGDRAAQCGANGCLRQVYTFEHGGWHLVRSYYEAGTE